MFANEETWEMMQKDLEVGIYTCHIKKNMFMESICLQKYKIDIFIRATKWKVKKYYNDGYIGIDNPDDRPLFRQMCNDIENNKFNFSKIIIFSTLLLTDEKFKVFDFINKLKSKKISLITIDPLLDSVEKYGVFGHTATVGLHNSCSEVYNHTYLLFTGKSDKNMKPSEYYKSSFQHILHLYEILKRDCLADNWMEIIRLSDMNRIFYYECEELHTDMYKMIMTKCNDLDLV